MKQLIIIILSACLSGVGFAQTWVDSRADATVAWQAYRAEQLSDVTAYTPVQTATNKYGSNTNYRSTATGFFRTEIVNGRWYIIDPEGYIFIHKGVACVEPGTSNRQKAAVTAKWGSNSQWCTYTNNWLKDYGFNGAGAWSNVALFRQQAEPVVYTVIVHPMDSYRNYHKKLVGGYHHASWQGYEYNIVRVFDPLFEKYMDNACKVMAQYKNDKYLLGYFVDNELPWVNDALDRHIRYLPTNDPGYIAAKKWLDARKGKNAGLSDITDADRHAFWDFYAGKYFKMAKEAITKYDPNHLFLGSRFNQGHEELTNPYIFETAGKYCDIISINHYREWEPISSLMVNWEEWSHKPFLITEFYTKGEDSGFTNETGAGWLVKTQRDRGLFYQNFILKLLYSKGCVGWNWFRYQDNDPEDLTTDPSNRNSNKGLVNINYDPYNDLLNLCKTVNDNVYGFLEYLKKNKIVAPKTPLYLDRRQPAEKRVQDLLLRMTLEEKVAQMSQYVGLEHIKTAEKLLTVEEMQKSHATGFYPGLHSSEVETMAKQGLIGSFLHVVTSQEANYLQALAMQSRLKIPVLIGIDAIHGNGLYRGATLYPTPIGQAAAFDENLVEQASRETALEMRASGMHWTFTPNVEVARDARWGRVGETFGEDPYLVARLGAATVRGFQTADYTGMDKVIACAKHFIGGSQPVNGINGAPADMSENTLWNVFMPPFRACADAGVYTFMTAHNELNGVPSHANKFLMTEVLRDLWNFQGFVVSDWMDIERLHDYHHTAETLKDAYFQSVNAGMDMHMHGPDFADKIIEAVHERKLSVERIDASVAKILTAKFKLGLFENPLVEPVKEARIVFQQKHQETALEMARKSIVLLKNEQQLLPIDRNKYKKILVTGPNANNQTILGDWALEQPDENVITIVQGLKKISPATEFHYYPFDWNLRTMQMNQVLEAKQQAASCDLAIVVVGENSMRYHWNEKTCGENSDRYDLSLAGLQEQLVEEIAATGIPVVVVLVNGRPLATEWIADHIPALIEAWEPGSFGGQAVAEILFGEVNPEGKLPITIPRHSGQIPVYYNHKFTSKWFDYSTGNSTPLFPFGYGLSYTRFEISPVKLSDSQMRADATVQASVEVVNTGKTAGTEVVQLYIRDTYSSMTRPLKELKAFRKVTLQPEEKLTVIFDITAEMLQFYGLNKQYVVEPGDFEISIGNSSREEDLKTAILKVI